MHPTQVLLGLPPPVVVPTCVQSVAVVLGALGKFLGVLAKVDSRSRADDGDALERRLPC
jgi:hypothetical protein